MSELIVIVRYDLHRHPTPKNEAVARDTVYGLFTVIFLLLLTQLVSDIIAPVTTSNPMFLERMKEDIRNHVRNTVDGIIKTNGGEEFTPAMGLILQALQTNPLSGLTQQGRAQGSGSWRAEGTACAARKICVAAPAKAWKLGLDRFGSGVVVDC